MELKVGQTFRVFYSEGNPNNRMIEIRAIVDGDHFVTRTWAKQRLHWYYAVENSDFFVIGLKSGILKKVK